ncbi:inverted formin-2-like [Schistocerca gregaria]|uniref:inverted formin-2-like n=1 Tax=Schistocerca gregaria TaxID=7010 RepID=UPI00211EF049|nr:inverted formin-2-like [Schistocerca gregaria]
MTVSKDLGSGQAQSRANTIAADAAMPLADSHLVLQERGCHRHNDGTAERRCSRHSRGRHRNGNCHNHDSQQPMDVNAIYSKPSASLSLTAGRVNQVFPDTSSCIQRDASKLFVTLLICGRSVHTQLDTELEASQILPPQLTTPAGAPAIVAVQSPAPDGRLSPPPRAHLRRPPPRSSTVLEPMDAEAAVSPSPPWPTEVVAPPPHPSIPSGGARPGRIGGLMGSTASAHFSTASPSAGHAPPWARLPSSNSLLPVRSPAWGGRLLPPPQHHLQSPSPPPTCSSTQPVLMDAEAAVTPLWP